MYFAKRQGFYNKSFKSSTRSNMGHIYRYEKKMADCSPLIVSLTLNNNTYYVPIHFKFQIRQIIGKQGRLTVKNVAESQRQNQNLPLDSSTVSSNPDSEMNPFLGRSLPR